MAVFVLLRILGTGKKISLHQLKIHYRKSNIIRTGSEMELENTFRPAFNTGATL